MRFLSLLLLLPLFGFSQLSQYVNPFIGTGGHGHTFPGATLPFGMVQLSPDTRIDGSWDGCSGYHYSDAVIYGFSHTHLSGTGVSDYGDIMLMPTMGEPMLEEEHYSSPFIHESEKASAGYYKVDLQKPGVTAELTASTRVGFHRYTFLNPGQANIVLDLNHRDQLIMGEVRVIDEKTVEVYRNSSAWAQNQKIFARIEFDRPMRISKVRNNAFAPAKTTDTFFAGSLLSMAFSSDVKSGETIQVKVSLSPTSYEGAAKNSREIKGWDFEKTKADAESAWNFELSKIEIPTDNREKATIFYTALYHTMLQPNIAQDIDGTYRGRDDQLHKAEGFEYYSVFSLWDTFWAAHPLYTLIQRKRTADFINTFLAQYDQGGRLPVWELASNETDCMIGYHSVSVMADAMAKGIKGFDYEKAFTAAKHSAMLDNLGLSGYKKNGFISMDDEHESVSKTVEYAYDDWCIARMARRLGKEKDYQYFIRRSQNWKNIFDPKTLHMRPKKNGGWDKPFDAREVNNNFTEGNSWQYSFFVPHDIPGMIEAYGGKEKFGAKLDEMFSLPSQTTGREQVDITGLIGQYAHGNEPSHHMAYLYNYIGQPEKTDAKVRFILDSFYKNSPDGLIGNEDCGQMSAWFVLSAMGMYPVTPGEPFWSATKPYFDKIRVHFEDGTNREIRSDSPRQYLERFASSFEGSVGDGSVIIRETVPGISVVPALEAPSKSFSGSMKVGFSDVKEGEEVFYRTDASAGFEKFRKPFSIGKTTTVEFFRSDFYDRKSDTVSATFFKKPSDFSASVKNPYKPKYSAGGPDGLLDGILGSENWRKGDWQGYQGVDFEAVIDLKKEMTVSEISARFLQDSRSWILMPVWVDFQVSKDGKHFASLGTVVTKADPKDEKTQVREINSAKTRSKARFVKVIARNFGTLPEWHQGSGGEAFIFIDEISVK